MAEKRFGRQTPTQSVVLNYSESLGSEAIALYEKSGRTAQPWQKLLCMDIMAINEEQLWVHPKFGYSVPRRNGKGEILTIRELLGLHAGEKILHTAHRTTTSSSAAARLANLLRDMGYKEVLRVKKDEKYTESFVYTKQLGLEKIELLDTGGYVSFRTRTSSGGLGEGYDLLVIDEAQEYTTDQQNTLQYVVSDSNNPQIILCGTPPTAVSAGTVFSSLRDDCLAGETEEVGWAEWSIEEQGDVNDIDLWYECNPALGFQLTERKIKNEDKKDVVDFNIQRFGYWFKYNLKSAISAAEWNALEVKKLPAFKNRDAFVGIKYGKDNTNVSMSVAVKTVKGNIFVEAIDCVPIMQGNNWLIDYLRTMKPKKIAVDGSQGAQLLKDIKDFGIKNAFSPTVAEVVNANYQFTQAIYSEALCHMAQPSLAAIVSNCEKRAIGNNGGFGYKSIKADYEIALMDSAILAFWLCAEAKEKKKQQVIC